MNSQNNNQNFFALSGTKRRTPAEQALEIKSTALSMLADANAQVAVERRVTVKSVTEVLWRSLNASRGLAFSARRDVALQEVADFIDAAQGNFGLAVFSAHSDLFPISHPYSSRNHSLTASGLLNARVQWLAADSMVSDELRPLVASALGAPSGSLESTYAVSRLNATDEGSFVLSALLAWGNPYAGKNSWFWRSLRAILQRRDSEGKFAEMGGGASIYVRMPDGSVQRGSGRLVGMKDGEATYDVEMPDGKIYRVQSNKSLAVSAVLPSAKGSSGFSGAPAEISVEDEKNVINFTDLVQIDRPAGWNAWGKPEKDANGNLFQSYIDESQEYSVGKLTAPDGTVTYRVRDEKDTDKSKILAEVGSWAEVIDALNNNTSDEEKIDTKARLETEMGTPIPDEYLNKLLKGKFAPKVTPPSGETPLEYIDESVPNKSIFKLPVVDQSGKNFEVSIVSSFGGKFEVALFDGRGGAAIVGEFDNKEDAFTAGRGVARSISMGDGQEVLDSYNPEVMRPSGETPTPSVISFDSPEFANMVMDSAKRNYFAGDEDSDGGVSWDSVSSEIARRMSKGEISIPRSADDFDALTAAIEGYVNPDASDDVDESSFIEEAALNVADGIYEKLVQQGVIDDFFGTALEDVNDADFEFNFAALSRNPNTIPDDMYTVDAPSASVDNLLKLYDADESKFQNFVEKFVDYRGARVDQQNARNNAPRQTPAIYFNDSEFEKIANHFGVSPEVVGNEFAKSINKIEEGKGTSYLADRVSESMSKYYNSGEEYVPSPTPPTRASSSDEELKRLYPNEEYLPTQEQADVIQAMIDGKDVVVKALAGTGKTSTLLLAGRRFAREMPNKRILYLVFNRKNAKEAVERFAGTNVEPKTMDSLSMKNSPISAMTARVKHDDAIKDFLNSAKALNISSYKLTVNGEEVAIPAEDVFEFARKAVDNFAVSADPTITADHFDLERVRKFLRDDNASVPAEFIDAANKIWEDLNDPKAKPKDRIVANYSDVMKAWALTNPDFSTIGGGYDLVMVDEGQDLNPVFTDVMNKNKGKVQEVYVGDSNQAMYAFRGGKDELDKVDVDERLPITESFRFGAEIADIGNRFLSLIGEKLRLKGRGFQGAEIVFSSEPAELPTPKGRIDGEDGEDEPAATPIDVSNFIQIDNPDVVLARTNGGIISAAIMLMGQGKVVGVSKKVKQDLQSLISTAAYLRTDGKYKKPSKLHDELGKYSSWKDFKDRGNPDNPKYDKAAAYLAFVLKQLEENPDFMKNLVVVGKDVADNIGAEEVTAENVQPNSKVLLAKDMKGKWDKSDVYAVVNEDGSVYTTGPALDFLSDFKSLLGMSYVKEQLIDEKTGKPAVYLRDASGSNKGKWKAGDPRTTSMVKSDPIDDVDDRILFIENMGRILRNEPILTELGEKDASRIADVQVSTVHTAKGLEWDRVQIWHDFKWLNSINEVIDMNEQDASEMMVSYVAATRAKKALGLGGLSWVMQLTSENGATIQDIINAMNDGRDEIEVPKVTPPVVLDTPITDAAPEIAPQVTEVEERPLPPVPDKPEKDHSEDVVEIPTNKPAAPKAKVVMLDGVKYMITEMPNGKKITLKQNADGKWIPAIGIPNFMAIPSDDPSVNRQNAEDYSDAALMDNLAWANADANDLPVVEITAEDTAAINAIKDGTTVSRAPEVKPASPAADKIIADVKSLMDDNFNGMRDTWKRAYDWLDAGIDSEDESPAAMAERFERLSKNAETDPDFAGKSELFQNIANAIRGRFRGDVEWKNRTKSQGAPSAPKFNVPNGAFVMNPDDYSPEGRIDEASTDFTDDPTRLANRFRAETLIKALSDALLGREFEIDEDKLPKEPVKPGAPEVPDAPVREDDESDSAFDKRQAAYERDLQKYEKAFKKYQETDDSKFIEEYEAWQAKINEIYANAIKANGFGLLPFSEGDEYVAAEAIRDALKEQGENVDKIVQDLYDDGFASSTNKVITTDAPTSVNEDSDIADIIEAVTETSTGTVSTENNPLSAINELRKEFSDEKFYVTSADEKSMSIVHRPSRTRFDMRMDDSGQFAVKVYNDSKDKNKPRSKTTKLGEFSAVLNQGLDNFRAMVQKATDAGINDFEWNSYVSDMKKQGLSPVLKSIVTETPTVEETKQDLNESDANDLPALLQGLTEAELAQYRETGDYTPFLPKNVDIEFPEYYGKVDVNPHPVNGTFYSDGSDDSGLPLGATDNPLVLAMMFDTQALKDALYGSILPVDQFKPATNQAMLGFEDENGETIRVIVDNAAIRDALQLQGVNTNEFLAGIKKELDAAKSAPTREDMDAVREMFPWLNDAEINNYLTGALSLNRIEELRQERKDQIPAATGNNNPSSSERSIGVHRKSVPVKDLKAGDVTTDGFVIESVGTEILSDIGRKKVEVLGYFPGHPTQSKPWNFDTNIEVFRGIPAEDMPLKGNLPELHKPKAEEFEGGINSDEFKLAYAKWRGEWRAAMARWTNAPAEFKGSFNYKTDPHTVLVLNKDLQPGDVYFGEHGGHFTVISVRIEERPNERNQLEPRVVINGYFPNHVPQTFALPHPETGQERVYRNVTLPRQGDLPKLRWRRDIAEAANTWEDKPEGDIPDITNMSEGELGLVLPNKPTLFLPSDPAFSGKFADIARAADGDLAALRDGLLKEGIVFDLETTGLDTGGGDSIWQIGAVRYKDGEITDRFNVYMNPEQTLNNLPEHVRNKFKTADGSPVTDEFLAEQMSKKEAFQKFVDWAGEGALLIGHNTAFDRPMLMNSLAKEGIDFNADGILDSLGVAKAYHAALPSGERPKKESTGRDSNALEVLAPFYGFNGLSHHNADVDAEATFEVLKKILDNMVAKDLGKDLFNVDAAQKKWEETIENFNNRTLPAYKRAIDEYNNIAGKIAAFRAVQKASGGDNVTADDVINEFNKITKKTDVPNSIEVVDGENFPNGFMKVMAPDWVLNDDNTFRIENTPTRYNDLVVGDFFHDSSGAMHQVIGVEHYTKSEPYKIKSRLGEFRDVPYMNISRINLNTGEVTNLTDVAPFVPIDKRSPRRPYRIGDLVPVQAGIGEDAPTDDTVDMTQVAPKVYEFDADDVTGFKPKVTVTKNSDGTYTGLLELVDADGDVLYSEEFNGNSEQDVVDRAVEQGKNINDAQREGILAAGDDADEPTETEESDAAKVAARQIVESEVITDKDGTQYIFEVFKEEGNPDTDMGLFKVITHTSANGGDWENDDADAPSFDTEAEAVQYFNDVADYAQKRASSPTTEEDNKPESDEDLDTNKSPNPDAPFGYKKDGTPRKKRAKGTVGYTVVPPTIYEGASPDAPFGYLPDGTKHAPFGFKKDGVTPAKRSAGGGRKKGAPNIKGNKPNTQYDKKKKKNENPEESSNFDNRRVVRRVYWRRGRAMFLSGSNRDIPVNEGDTVSHMNLKKFREFKNGAFKNNKGLFAEFNEGIVVKRILEKRVARDSKTGEKVVVIHDGYVTVEFPDGSTSDYTTDFLINKTNPDGIESPNNSVSAIPDSEFMPLLVDINEEDWAKFDEKFAEMGVKRDPAYVDGFSVEITTSRGAEDVAIEFDETTGMYTVWNRMENIHGVHDNQKLIVTDDIQSATDYFATAYHNSLYDTNYLPPVLKADGTYEFPHINYDAAYRKDDLKKETDKRTPAGSNNVPTSTQVPPVVEKKPTAPEGRKPFRPKSIQKSTVTDQNGDEFDVSVAEVSPNRFEIAIFPADGSDSVVTGSFPDEDDAIDEANTIARNIRRGNGKEIVDSYKPEVLRGGEFVPLEDIIDEPATGSRFKVMTVQTPEGDFETVFVKVRGDGSEIGRATFRKSADADKANATHAAAVGMANGGFVSTMFDFPDDDGDGGTPPGGGGGGTPPLGNAPSGGGGTGVTTTEDTSVTPDASDAFMAEGFTLVESQINNNFVAYENENFHIEVQKNLKNGKQYRPEAIKVVMETLAELHADYPTRWMESNGKLRVLIADSSLNQLPYRGDIEFEGNVVPLYPFAGTIPGFLSMTFDADSFTQGGSILTHPTGRATDFVVEMGDFNSGMAALSRTEAALRNLTTHEWGHMLQYKLTTEDLQKFFDRIQAKAAARTGDVRIPKYALEKPTEAFAEAFASNVSRPNSNFSKFTKEILAELGYDTIFDSLNPKTGTATEVTLSTVDKENLADEGFKQLSTNDFEQYWELMRGVNIPVGGTAGKNFVYTSLDEDFQSVLSKRSAGDTNYLAYYERLARVMDSFEVFAYKDIVVHVPKIFSKSNPYREGSREEAFGTLKELADRFPLSKGALGKTKVVPIYFVPAKDLNRSGRTYGRTRYFAEKFGAGRSTDYNRTESPLIRFASEFLTEKGVAGSNPEDTTKYEKPNALKYKKWFGSAAYEYTSMSSMIAHEWAHALDPMTHKDSKKLGERAYMERQRQKELRLNRRIEGATFGKTKLSDEELIKAADAAFERHQQEDDSYPHLPEYGIQDYEKNKNKKGAEFQGSEIFAEGFMQNFLNPNNLFAKWVAEQLDDLGYGDVFKTRPEARPATKQTPRMEFMSLTPSAITREYERGTFEKVSSDDAADVVIRGFMGSILDKQFEYFRSRFARLSDSYIRGALEEVLINQVDKDIAQIVALKDTSDFYTDGYNILSVPKYVNLEVSGSVTDYAAKTKEFVDTFTDLSNNYDAGNSVRVFVVDSNNLTSDFKDILGTSVGVTNRGMGRIIINSNVFNKTRTESAAAKRWFGSAGYRVPPALHTLVHEWGHAIDPASKEEKSDLADFLSANRVENNGSLAVPRYVFEGKHTKNNWAVGTEAFAEAFVKYYFEPDNVTPFAKNVERYLQTFGYENPFGKRAAGSVVSNISDDVVHSDRLDFENPENSSFDVNFSGLSSAIENIVAGTNAQGDNAFDLSRPPAAPVVESEKFDADVDKYSDAISKFDSLLADDDYKNYDDSLSVEDNGMRARVGFYLSRARFFLNAETFDAESAKNNLNLAIAAGYDINIADITGNYNFGSWMDDNVRMDLNDILADIEFVSGITSAGDFFEIHARYNKLYDAYAPVFEKMVNDGFDVAATDITSNLESIIGYLASGKLYAAFKAAKATREAIRKASDIGAFDSPNFLPRFIALTTMFDDYANQIGVNLSRRNNFSATGVSADKPASMLPADFDPISIREDRIAGGLNKVSIPEFIANSTSSFSAGIDEEIENFVRNKTPQPLSVLSADARRELAGFIKDEIFSNGDANLDSFELEDFFKLNAALHAERLAYEPNATSLGVADFLRDVDVEDIEAAVPSDWSAPDVWSRFSLDGNYTGFSVKKSSDGGGTDSKNRTFFLRHDASGQMFIYKQDANPDAAKAEVAASELMRGLGILGASYVAPHWRDSTVVVSTYVGSNLESANNNAPRSGRDFSSIAGATFLSTIKDNLLNLGDFHQLALVGVLDAVLSNYDRHNGNWMFTENVGNGHGFVNANRVLMLPIDHGLSSALTLDATMQWFEVDPVDYIINNPADIQQGGKLNVANALHETLGDVYFKLASMSSQQALQYLRSLYPVGSNPQMDVLVGRLSEIVDYVNEQIVG